MFRFIRRLTRRVIRLSREADAIGDGDLEAPITLQGEDELAQLAGEMDAMRHSVIERMSGERRAWEANSELITAISHDIRTPMTALIGYLGLLNESGFQDPERGAQFAASAYDKAMELKDLTDELFKYFLVFGRSELELNKEELRRPLLLEQLLGEAEFDLTDAGFTVQRIEFEGECTVQADPLYLKRVMDNLVSNIKKYADPSARSWCSPSCRTGSCPSASRTTSSALWTGWRAPRSACAPAKRSWRPWAAASPLQATGSISPRSSRCRQWKRWRSDTG